MRYGIFAATLGGKNLALRVADALIGERHIAELFIHERFYKDENRESCFRQYTRLGEIVPELFDIFDGLIFIMSTGIVVRTIGPLLKSKLSDPAVVVLDEGGRFAISLLSGHMGGANALCQWLEERLGMQSVITTATDVRGLTAPDKIAATLNMMPYPKQEILNFNSSILRGQGPIYILDPELPCLGIYEKKLSALDIPYTIADKNELKQLLGQEESKEKRILLTAQEVVEKANLLILRPKTLVAGIGCRRGTKKEDILKALEDASQALGWPIERIDYLASVDIKRDEEGLLEVSKYLGKKISFIERSKIKRIIEVYHLQESAFVKRTLGIGNVCEASALALLARGSIGIGKSKYEKVTVSLVWEK